MNTPIKLKEQQMNFNNWAAMEKARMFNTAIEKISATYASKVRQATTKKGAAKPMPSIGAAMRNQSDSEKNRLKLAAALSK